MLTESPRSVGIPFVRLAIVLCLLLQGAAPRLDSDKPVNMRSKGGLQIDLEKKIGTARGDVVIEREDVTVCCDEAEAHYSGQRIERVTCRGRVVIVRPDGTTATADVAVFVAEKDNVTLTGRAKVYAPDATLIGERIVYDIGRDKLSVEGKDSRFSFSPKGAKKPGLRACPPPP